MAMDTLVKRFKLHHVLDYSSNPPPFPSSAISTATTLKVFLSWCKDEQKENPRVIALVAYLRQKLWEKGIEVFDSDVERCVREERYIPILIGTLGYFNDVNCLNELKVICESHHVWHILPIFYDPDGKLRQFYLYFKTGPEREKPLLLPLDTHWSPPPDDVDDDAATASDDVNDDGNDKDNDDDDVDDNVTDDDDGDDDDVDGDVSDDDDDDDDEVVDDEAYFGDMSKMIEEEELTLGLALIKLTSYIEWLREPIANDNKAECDYIDHYVLLVWMFLNPTDLDYTYLVGLESHLDRLKPYIFSEKESMYIAIVGPEGSGKTTTAKFIYNMFSNVHPSFHHTRMISHPTSLNLKELAVKVFDLTAGITSGDSWNPNAHKWTTRSYKTYPLLIIFDNINTVDDFNYVAPVLSLLPENGSKVVFTTRDGYWLDSVPQHRFQTYPIPSLDVHSSLELFCLKAFKQNQPPNRYKKLADNVVNMANGIPLDLVHCASQFCLMNKDDNWTMAFKNNEDMDSLFWSKYEQRSSKPITIGICDPDRDWFGDTPLCIRKHAELLFKIVRCLEANALDCEADRARTIYCV